LRVELKMEQLSPELRQNVVKMSEARLRQKLVQAGYREVVISTFDRATLLEYYAKVLLTETAYVPAKEKQDEDEGGGDGVEEVEFVESKAGVQHTAGGEMSVEEKRLAMVERLLLLEERKLEEQRLQQEEHRLHREQQQELQRMQLEQQREIKEKRLEEQRWCRIPCLINTLYYDLLTLTVCRHMHPLNLWRL